ncbi:hypothetical protein CBS101457_001291 [Exobasidium rhododendri]|nr:hypothetical protein CBS101457_001291 [Exobasidium rhododendri]
MFPSASTSKVAAGSKRSRQQSMQSQMSEMGAEEEDQSINHSGTGSRRVVNRSNPQMSYAYGAPSDETKILKKARTSGKDISSELEFPPSPPPTFVKEEVLDAVSRYAARRKNLNEQQSPKKKATSKIESVDSPRRSTRLSASGSQDGVLPQDRRRAIAAIEVDQAVEEEEEEEERASSSASQQLRNRLLSPGQSRSVNTHVSSFYLDAHRSTSDDDGASRGGMNGFPTSLLRGAQRPPHEHVSADMSGFGMQSVQSSELGDSRSHDYLEEERLAQMLDQSSHQASISAWSPKAWFKSKPSQGISNERKSDAEGEKSAKSKGRDAGDLTGNQLLHSKVEEHAESDSGTSMEGKKHGHHKKKSGVTSGEREGRNSKKANDRRDSKRSSRDGMGEGEANGEVGEEGETKSRRGASPFARNLKKLPGAIGTSLGPSIPFWALLLSGLLLLGSLGLHLQTRKSGTGPFSSSRNGFLSSISTLDSVPQASERIVRLESAFEALKSATIDTGKEGERLTARLDQLEKESDKANRQFSSSQKAMERQLKGIEAESSKIKTEMDTLQTRLKTMHAESRSEDLAASSALKKRLDALENRMKLSDKQTNEAIERARAAEKVATEAKSSLDWLERKLPAEVAVPVQSKSGKPLLDATTLQGLKKLFVSKEDADFQSKNEEAMRSLSLEALEGQIKTGAILGRDDFLQLLYSELDKAKSSMEARFNSNVEGMQNEILAKVRTQQDMFEKSGSWKKKSSSRQESGSSLDELSVGATSKEAIVALIEEALEIYSADRLARRDFALYTAGGRVIPSLTSPTYNLQSRSFFSLGGNRKQVEKVKPPVIALHYETSPGMCWAFQGDDGQLGIGLARKVIVSDITLEHVSPSISLEAGTSAPRDVTVWGLVERQEDQRRLVAYRLSQQQQQQQRDEDHDLYVDFPTAAPPSNHHLLLSSFTYDIASNRAIQTFPASKEARTLQIPVNIVQVRVTSNHGNKDFTCLYRIRVHGQEWTGEGDE